ncbi:MAG: hypothetical protein U0270_00500 [Labilithrix sp.]
MRWNTWIAVGFLALGCAKPVPTKSPEPAPPVVPARPLPAAARLEFEPVLVDPAVGGEAVEDELTTVVTPSDDELVTFVERVTSPEKIAPDSPLRGRRPTDGVEATRIEMRRGTFACFARRTPRDARAAVIRSSSQGQLIPPLRWMAEVVRLPGATDDEARAWYKEMSRRIATTGRATGIARFDNGNAIAILIELRGVAPGDTELVAKTQFFEANAYSAEAWGPIVRGARSVETRKMNKHRGVSVFDLLRSLHHEQRPSSTDT